jgi:hypothetical protein
VGATLGVATVLDRPGLEPIRLPSFRFFRGQSAWSVPVFDLPGATYEVSVEASEAQSTARAVFSGLTAGAALPMVELRGAAETVFPRPNADEVTLEEDIVITRPSEAGVAISTFTMPGAVGSHVFVRVSAATTSKFPKGPFDTDVPRAGQTVQWTVLALPVAGVDALVGLVPAHRSTDGSSPTVPRRSWELAQSRFSWKR